MEQFDYHSFNEYDEMNEHFLFGNKFKIYNFIRTMN